MTDRRRPSLPPPDLSHKPPALDTPSPFVPGKLAEISLSGGADDDAKTIPFAFGLVETEGSIRYAFQPASSNDLWIVRALALGEREATIYGGEQAGECDGLVGIYTDNAVFNTAGLQYWFVSGSLSQTVNTALAALDPLWAETLVITDKTGKRRAICGVIERWISVGANFGTGIPKVKYRFRGSRLLNTTTGLVAYTVNPWWQARFWALDPSGARLKPSRINEASFQAAAAASPSNQYESHLLLSGTTRDARKMFALLGDGWLVFAGGNQLTAIADRATAPVATYDDSHFAKAQEIEAGPVAEPDQMVNKVSIEYTDTSAVSGLWATKTLSLQTAGLTAGTETEVPVVFKFPQIHDPAIVNLKLAYLLYAYQEFRIKGTWLANAGGPRLIGDVVTQSIPARGITDNFRVAFRDKLPNGTYQVELALIDARKWAGAASTAPVKVGSTLQDPYSPPDILLASIAWTEESYQDQSGQFWQRVRVAWTNPTYQFIDGVEAYLSVAGGERRCLPGDVVSPALINEVMEVGVAYTLTLVVRSKAGARSAGTSITRTIVGAAAPADPQGFGATVNFDYAFLSWLTVPDPSVEWELREGATTDSWSTATPMSRLSHPSFIATPRYGRTVRYFLKAVAYGQYSVNAAIADVAFAAIGGQVTEFVPGWFPDASFTRVVAFGNPFGPDPYTGLWVSGQLNVLVTINPNGMFIPIPGYNINAYLARSLTPAAINAEMTAAGLTTLAQWSAQIDDPRRQGQGLWAPLPPNASGEMWGGLMNFADRMRLGQVRSRLTSVTHVGIDTPATDGLAQSILVDNPALPAAKPILRGSVFPLGPEARTRGYGFRLASNSPCYQQQLASIGGIYPYVGPFAFSFDQREYRVQLGSVTTDAGGIASIGFNYPPLAGTANAQKCYTVRGAAGATAAKIFVVDHLENTPTQTLRVKVYNNDGTVAAGITAEYELIDNGNWPSSGMWLP